MISVFRRVKFSISFIFFQQILQQEAGENNTDDLPSDEGSDDNDDDDYDDDDDHDDGNDEHDEGDDDDEDDDDYEDGDDDDNEISEEKLKNASDGKKIVLSTVNEFINILVLPMGTKL